MPQILKKELYWRRDGAPEIEMYWWVFCATDNEMNCLVGRWGCFIGQNGEWVDADFEWFFGFLYAAENE